MQATHSRIAFAIIIVVILLGAYGLLAWTDTLAAITDRAALERYVVQLGLFGPLTIIALLAAAIVLNPIPSAPIALAAGAVYGHLCGTVYVVTGAELGALIAFAVARLVGYEVLRSWLGDRISLGPLASQNTMMGIVFVSRLMPFISFDLVSYAAGLTPLAPWRFALATLAGIVPTSFLLAHFGGELSSADGAGVMATVLALGALTLVPVAAKLILNWYKGSPDRAANDEPRPMEGLLARKSFSMIAPSAGSHGIGPETYARWRRSELGAITDEIEHALFFETAGRLAGKRVLDVGCGDGSLAVSAWEKGASVTGLDVSAPMIEAARERVRARRAEIGFVQGRAEQLPFPDGSFDLVFSVTTLCFVADAAGALGEMARVLKPGGCLVVGELGRWSVWAVSRRLRGWLGNTTWRNARFWTAGQLRDVVLGASLDAGPVKGAVYYPPSRWFAWLMGPIDGKFGRLTAMGAAFLVIRAQKPIDSLVP